MTTVQPSVRAALRLEPGKPADPTAIDPAAIPIGPKSKQKAARDAGRVASELDDLQEALYAQGAAGGGRRRLLLVLQGMDTSGKGGTIRHAAGVFNPQGLHIASFKKPTPEELRHHFLWRIRRQVPSPGMIGVFDRSHYEDVLIVRVDQLVPEAQWRSRYDEINDFEAELVADGVTIVKCFLHISPQEQRERLLARLDNPAKHWKYNPADVDNRAKWNDYQFAYAEALQRCGTAIAPWYVIPSDRKWYRNWAVTRILLETLRELDPRYPPARFDVAAERARLMASTTAPVDKS
jgi:PPK2 family polyphosphate:nucleotide phosphotransferase